ncbi:odorant receptor 94b-like [Bradysia coprophila]|uniref:odorant receptor 94b-like n=1 Tax=Bradysia coprophila TaxID=38358 RepID=UPI00187DAA69|nr:odorant receptor 94b-like [Bradysia coprophila]
MATIEADKMLQQISKIFYLSGIWQSDGESKYRKISKKCFYSLFAAWIPIFFAINAFRCVDRNESVHSAQIAVLTAVEYVKFLYLMYKKQEILSFLNDPIFVHSIQNREEYELANRKIEKLMKFLRPYCLAIFITVFLVIVIKLPIFSADKGLPFFISFTWNVSEIFYWLAYLIISLSIVLSAVINFITVLVWYIMLNYSIEYELLGNKLKTLGVSTEKDKNQDKNDKQKKIVEKIQSRKSQIGVQQSKKFVENLIVLIKAHRNLTETVERFRSCFSTLFLAQITISGIIICVSVYSLAFTSNRNIVQTEFYFAELLYGFFDIFLVMYLANDITVMSDRLSYCLFSSNWIEQTESCKKYVLIMGEMLKQPQQLVILIYPMNLETFLKIVKGAYSMFNILKSL